MPLKSGSRLGHFEIVSSLGAGGMGEVYRAKDTRLDREVAIKVLPDAVVSEPLRVARFEREAKALATLNHPNVATIHGIERDARGEPFLVMELVEGPTLADQLARGPMRWRQASSVFLEIARGLEAAHERGIVHRDLKPANLKVSVDEVSGAVQVKILDFGLAKAMSVEPASAASGSMEDTGTLPMPATARGVVMGTPGYLAPEQARGSAVDKRADVWAFGVCLFEALTGRSAFGGDSVSDRLASVLKDDPDWSLLPAGIPRALATLLRRCLRKAPADRLRDIGDARIVLTELLADPEPAELLGEPLVASPALSGARVRRGPALAAVAVVALASSAATWLLVRGEGESAPLLAVAGAPVRFTIGNEREEPFADVGGVVISPDGRWVVVSGGSTESEGAVVGISAGSEPLRVRALDRFDDSVRVLEGTAGALYPFFSPDSQWVGFFLGGGGVRTLYRVNLESGVVQPITTEPHPGYRADWTDDEHAVLGGQRSGLARVDLTTGRLEPFTRAATDAGEMAHLHPEVLPHGRGVVFTALTQDAGLQIRVWDARTDAIRTLVQRGGEARYHASGHLLYGLDGALYAIELDLDRLEAVGDPRALVQGVATGTLGETYFDVSNDGTLVYLPGSEQRARRLSLVWTRPDGSVDEELARGDIHHPTIAPDGQRWLARTSRHELSVFDRGAPLPRRFGTAVPPATAPLFLVDGSSILYGQPGSGARESSLYVLDMVTGSSTPFGRGDGEARLPVALDTSRNEVISLTTRTTAAGAWRTSLVASDLAGEASDRDLVTGDVVVGGARLSPDGTRLAYSVLTSDAFTQISTLYVADYPEMKRRLAISDGMSDNGYAWAPDGRLWFADAPDHTIRVVRFAPGPLLEVSSIEPVFELGVLFWTERGFAVAPDGRLLMVRGTREAGGLAGRIRVVVGWAREQGLDVARSGASR
jgi:eukaryotic-like serine/threonine-protein kinase